MSSLEPQIEPANVCLGPFPLAVSCGEGGGGGQRLEHAKRAGGEAHAAPRQLPQGGCKAPASAGKRAAVPTCAPSDPSRHLTAHHCIRKGADRNFAHCSPPVVPDASTHVHGEGPGYQSAMGTGAQPTGRRTGLGAGGNRAGGKRGRCTRAVHGGKAVQQVVPRHPHMGEADGAVVDAVQPNLNTHRPSAAFHKTPELCFSSSAQGPSRTMHLHESSRSYAAG